MLWPFGHGLTFTSFNFTKLQIVANSTAVSVSCLVTNVGPVSGIVTAQLYLRHTVSSVTTPVKMLKGIVKAPIAAGGSSLLTFPLLDVASELRVLGRDFRWRVEPGDVLVSVGESSADISLQGSFGLI